MGAAIATVVAYTLLFVAMAWRAHRVFPVPYQWRRVATAAFAAVGLTLIGKLLDVPLPVALAAHGGFPARAAGAGLLSPGRAPAASPAPAYPGAMSLLAAILVASTSLHITVWPNGADKPGKARVHASLRSRRRHAAAPRDCVSQPLAAEDAVRAGAQGLGLCADLRRTSDGTRHRPPTRQASPCGLQPEGRLRDRELEPRPLPLPRQPLLVARRPRTPARLR